MHLIMVYHTTLCVLSLVNCCCEWTFLNSRHGVRLFHVLSHGAVVKIGARVWVDVQPVKHIVLLVRHRCNVKRLVCVLVLANAET